MCIEQAAKAKPAEKEKKEEKDVCVNGEFGEIKKCKAIKKGKIFLYIFYFQKVRNKHILAHICSYLCVR